MRAVTTANTFNALHKMQDHQRHTITLTSDVLKVIVHIQAEGIEEQEPKGGDREKAQRLLHRQFSLPGYHHKQRVKN